MGVELGWEDSSPLTCGLGDVPLDLHPLVSGHRGALLRLLLLRLLLLLLLLLHLPLLRVLQLVVHIVMPVVVGVVVVWGEVEVRVRRLAAQDQPRGLSLLPLLPLLPLRRGAALLGLARRRAVVGFGQGELLLEVVRLRGGG